MAAQLNKQLILQERAVRADEVRQRVQVGRAEIG